ncbi:hypothetical protein ACQFX9_19925 [Aliinostoc sp. HNIBRCY26]|uniref:hypothetical protein n=1 Tax=Aliinostoc sp. HNIBRCY26 TaxID=3418997 RepID=UPI003D088C6D
MKYKLIFAPLIVFSVQIIANKTLAQEIKKDSIVPPQKDAVAFAKSICGVGNFTQKKGAIVCNTCPSFTGYRDTTGTLTSVVYGSFTKAGTREALVDLSDCEPHAGNWGGTVLLRHTNNGWSRVRYESGFRSNMCLKITNRTGRNSVICQGAYTGMGYLITWLDKLEFNSTKTINTNLLKVESNTGSCRPPYYEMLIQDFKLQDTNQDKIPDLVVKVSEARGANNTNVSGSDGCVEPRLTQQKYHQLIFLSNGNSSFRPTAKTANLIKLLNVQQ